MIDQHSVTVLSDLIEQLESDIDRYEISTSQALARAYAAGADQQLERDAKWLDANALFTQNLTITPPGNALREAMRPKPPSLKQQALATLEEKPDHGKELLVFNTAQVNIIRRALEALPE